MGAALALCVRLQLARQCFTCRARQSGAHPQESCEYSQVCGCAGAGNIGERGVSGRVSKPCIMGKKARAEACSKKHPTMALESG